MDWGIRFKDVFAFYGLIVCYPHFCETERLRKGGKKNTSGGAFLGSSFHCCGYDVIG